MVALRWFAAFLFVVSIPVFLVLSNVRIAASDQHVFDYAFSQYDAPARTGIERVELDRAGREIVEYFETSQPGSLLDIRVTVLGTLQPLFTEREILHMSDVRDLLQVVFRIHELSFVYVAGYVVAVYLWSRERSMRRLARQLATAGALTAGIFAFAALGVLVGFDTLFTQFHVLSFSNDFWQLDPTRHHLIQMFPQGFWFDVTLGVGVVSILEGGLLTAISLGYMTWLDRDRSRSGWPLPVVRW